MGHLAVRDADVVKIDGEGLDAACPARLAGKTEALSADR